MPTMKTAPTHQERVDLVGCSTRRKSFSAGEFGTTSEGHFDIAGTDTPDKFEGDTVLVMNMYGQSSSSTLPEISQQAHSDITYLETLAPGSVALVDNAASLNLFSTTMGFIPGTYKSEDKEIIIGNKYNDLEVSCSALAAVWLIDKHNNRYAFCQRVCFAGDSVGTILAESHFVYKYGCVTSCDAVRGRRITMPPSLNSMYHQCLNKQGHLLPRNKIQTILTTAPGQVYSLLMSPNHLGWLHM